MKLLTLSTTHPDFKKHFHERLYLESSIDASIAQRVTDVISDVRQRGDAAVLDYTAQWDRLQMNNMQDLMLEADDFAKAYHTLPSVQQKALEQAAKRIQIYHEHQSKTSGQSWHYVDELGCVLGQKVTPLDRVGLYVPGGKAAYPSSILMNAIPAAVAGVKDIVMVVPMPSPVLTQQKQPNPLVLAAAHVAGVTQAWAIGGAQAVAALAYGTQSIQAVDKITGPGNAYVAEAKRQVFGKVGIDMIAGPSEILVLADGTTPADWVAMDLFSQAEHDEMAQSILISPNAAYLEAVVEAMQRLLPTLPRRTIIEQSLNQRALLIHTQSMEEACELSNLIAPEHLEIACQDPHPWEPYLRHAGAIFMGAYTSESLGDYCVGANHVLPTSGTARFSSALGVMDFQKRSSLIEVPAQASVSLGQIAYELAMGEGLQAHAESARLRSC